MKLVLENGEGADTVLNGIKLDGTVSASLYDKDVISIAGRQFRVEDQGPSQEVAPAPAPIVSAPIVSTPTVNTPSTQTAASDRTTLPTPLRDQIRCVHKPLFHIANFRILQIVQFSVVVIL